MSTNLAQQRDCPTREEAADGGVLCDPQTRLRSGPAGGEDYSPKWLEVAFCELRLLRVLRTSHFADGVGPVLLASCASLFAFTPPGIYLGRPRVRTKGGWLSADERSLRSPGRWWGMPRRGRWAGLGAAPGARGDPQGAQRRGWLHLRCPGRHLRRVAGARGHRRLGGIRACTRYGGERGQRACRDLLACP